MAEAEQTDSVPKRLKTENTNLEVAKKPENVVFLSKEDRIVNFWQSLKQKPVCIAFDLDYTLWPFPVASQMPPFHVTANKEIYDRKKKRVRLYEDIALIMKTLRDRCFPLDDEKRYLAIAGRTSAHEEAFELLRLADLITYFDSVQIYSGNKKKHIRRIRHDLRLKNFKYILLFDDYQTNTWQTEALSLGVVSYQVHRNFGLGVDELLEGLRKYNLKPLNDNKNEKNNEKNNED